MEKTLFRFTFFVFIALFTLSFSQNASAQAGATVETVAEVSTQADVRTPEARKKMEEERKARMEEKKNALEVRTQNFEEKKGEFEQKKEDRMEKRDDRKESRRVEAESRIGKHIEWMTKRFNGTIERLEKITARIESRIIKLKAEGKTTVEAENHVALAKAEIASAKTGIAKISLTLSSALEKEKLNGSFEEMRNLVKSIRDDLKTAHAELVKAITSIKGLRGEAKAETETSARVETVQ